MVATWTIEVDSRIVRVECTLLLREGQNLRAQAGMYARHAQLGIGGGSGSGFDAHLGSVEYRRANLQHCSDR